MYMQFHKQVFRSALSTYLFRSINRSTHCESYRLCVVPSPRSIAFYELLALSRPHPVLFRILSFPARRRRRRPTIAFALSLSLQKNENGPSLPSLRPSFHLPLMGESKDDKPLRRCSVRPSVAAAHTRQQMTRARARVATWDCDSPLLLSSCLEALTPFIFMNGNYVAGFRVISHCRSKMP